MTTISVPAGAPTIKSTQAAFALPPIFLANPPQPPPAIHELSPACKPSTSARLLITTTLLPIAATASILLTTPLLPTHAESLPPATPPTTAAVSPRHLSDPARIFATGQAARLSTRLSQLEADTGLRLFIVTRRGTGSVGNFRWPNPTPDTAVIAVDATAGNILSFSVGTNVQSKGLRPNFWVEAANRFGNVFNVREQGVDRAVEQVVDAVETCVRGARICQYVPGVSADQWKVSVVSAMVGGVMVGGASRTGGKRWNWPFVVLFSPLWAIFLVSFGVGPIVQRQPGLGVEVGSVIAAFTAAAGVIWAWIPSRFGIPGEEEV